MEAGPYARPSRGLEDPRRITVGDAALTRRARGSAYIWQLTASIATGLVIHGPRTVAGVAFPTQALSGRSGAREAGAQRMSRPSLSTERRTACLRGVKQCCCTQRRHPGVGLNHLVRSRPAGATTGASVLRCDHASFGPAPDRFKGRAVLVRRLIAEARPRCPHQHPFAGATEDGQHLRQLLLTSGAEPVRHSGVERCYLICPSTRSRSPRTRRICPEARTALRVRN